MAGSQEFRTLRTRIRQLRNHFLPRRFDPTGSYSERQFDRARAFRLLAHAEIESYLELVSFETANKAYDAWQARGIITEPLISMVAYTETPLGKVPETKPGTGKADLQIRIEKSRNSLTSYSRARNNGIREKNILRLLLPVGITEADLDSIWLSTIDSFGKDRGETAHQSNRVSNPPDPKNEFDKVAQIVKGLTGIDRKLLAFRSL